MRRERTSGGAVANVEDLLRILILIPQAICAGIVIVFVVSYFFKAYILSNRNNDSFWWHFGELRFYALDTDWWSGFVISVSIVLAVVAIIIVCWVSSVYCAQSITERSNNLDLENMRLYSLHPGRIVQQPSQGFYNPHYIQTE